MESGGLRSPRNQCKGLSPFAMSSERCDLSWSHCTDGCEYLTCFVLRWLVLCKQNSGDLVSAKLVVSRC